jgi:sirohydrochlorin cobaltochelatase
MNSSFDRTETKPVGLLIVGHGTRNPVGCEEFLTLANLINQYFPKNPVEAGFLELATPSIEDALSKLAGRGCDRFAVLPILLFCAGHAKSDIPNEVQSAASKLGMTCLGQSAPLGASDFAVRLSHSRFLEAASQEPMVNLATCGLCMIGRGASDTHAIDEMMLLVEKRRLTTPVRWTTTGFFAVAEPTVDQVLFEASKTDCPTIFVQPHLLFEGQLTRELRDKIEVLKSSSTKDFRLVPALGPRKDVAEAFASEFAKNQDFGGIFANNLGSIP